MGPPIPGYPRGNKGSVVPDSDPPPPARAKQVTLSEADRNEVKAFHAGNGKIGITIGTNALVAAITAGLTWLTTHQGSTPVDCASKAELASVERKVDALTADVAAVGAKVNAEADRSANKLEIIKMRIEALAR
jgi:uncharacterized membrane protein